MKILQTIAINVDKIRVVEVQLDLAQKFIVFHEMIQWYRNASL